MKNIDKSVIEVGATTADASRMPYTHPRVKLHDFGLADIICASGCSGDSTCIGGGYACEADDSSCQGYEKPADV